tara:strand:- start:752 stop:1930 length:1179 start_codon:yes stop_codon:yes gene_type:complete
MNEKLNPMQRAMVEYAVRNFNTDLLTAKEVKVLIKEGLWGKEIHNWMTAEGYRFKEGNRWIHRIPTELLENPESVQEEKTQDLESDYFKPIEDIDGLNLLKQKEENRFDVMNFIPSVDPNYIAWGNHKDVQSIVKSRMFFPMFITGLSGNGKTFMVEQVCAKLKRECVRVNVTIETDEDDLLGGFRLQDGQTVFHKGPVVEAMERGAVLLLDEVDLASSKILCLQPVLEGKGVFLKKINQWITPAEGFNVIATANTKGKGSESGQFMGTNILNEAFLERFAITLEQEYTQPKTEVRIVKSAMGDKVDEEFASKLVDWAKVIRDTHADGGIDEIISTRRLVHIAKSYAIFGDRMKSIELCVARFDSEIKDTFLDLYTKIDSEVQQPSEEEMPF